MRQSPRSRLRRLPIVVVIALAIVVTGVLLLGNDLFAAAAPTTTTTTTTATTTSAVDGNRVLLVGDSLLYGSTDQVTSALTSEGWDPVVAAVSGTSIEDWTASMAELIAVNQPDVIVIELGTNDCNATCTGLADAIDALMSSVPATIPVYWLDVQEQPSYPVYAAEVNDELLAAAARYAQITLVDMDARFRDHPEWHVDDGLHFNADGAEQLASLIADALTPDG